MRRRDFITAVASSTIAWSNLARARQPEHMRRIGFIGSAADPDEPFVRRLIAAFRTELNKLGWVEGRNISIIFRWSGGRREKIAANARELVALKPDVVVAIGGPATTDMIAATRTVPIVFTLTGDPVSNGLVTNLAHPGGNVTGFGSMQDLAIAGKQLQLLKEMAPKIERVLVLMAAGNPLQRLMRDTAARAAHSFGVTITSAEIGRPSDYAPEIEAFAREPNGGLIVLSSAIANTHPETIHELAVHYRLPAIYGFSFFVQAGGLIAYGSDPIDEFPAAALYVDRILRGAKPGDLPVQEPAKFELAINLKTARALGLTVPPLLLARADTVID